MKKILPISILAVITACPAFADEPNIIDDESMCVVGTLNQHANNSTAGIQAIWIGGAYSEDPGYYLLYNSQTDTLTPNTQCPAGSWCPGFTNQTFADATIGINTCPNDYSNSVAGSSANTQCYRTCSTDDVAHSATVSGQMYYDGTSGDGVNACEPLTCVAGWHKKNGLNLTTAIGTGEGASYAYNNNNNTFSEGYASYGQSFYGINGANTWAVNYGNNGMLVGQARCSTQQGYNNNWTWTNPTTFASLTDETGQEGAKYCYCNVTGYTPASGTLQSVSSSWMFLSADSDGASGCASKCALNCVSYMRYGDAGLLAYRAALLGSVASGPASCEANTINLNWYSVGDTVYERSTCTYDEQITLPETNPTRPGYVFSGWRLRTSQGE